MGPNGSHSLERRLVLAAVLALSTCGPSAASEWPPWTIVIDGREHAASAPLEVIDDILLDAVALAPALGLEVALDESRVRVVDVLQGVWSGRLGGSILRNGAEVLELGWVRAGSGHWFIPAPVLAQLARRDLRVDPSRRRIEFLGAAAGGSRVSESAGVRLPEEPSADGSEGWETFTLPKSAETLRDEARASASLGGPVTPRLPIHLPPANDRVRFDLALGHVLGADWGLDASAYGSVGDVGVQFATFLTSGAEALDVYSGRLRLDSAARGWGLTAGDVHSEAWGYARGARFSWRAGAREPSLGIYLPGSRTGYDEPIVAYRDELPLGDRAAVGGELTSDGAWLVRGRMRQGRLSLYGYLRDTGSEAGSSRGTTFRLDLSRGMALQGSFHGSRIGDHGTDLGTLSLRVPLPARGDGVVEVYRSESPTTRSDAQSATVSMPLGRVRLRTRYQLRQTTVETSPGAAGAAARTYESREIHGALTAGGRRFRIDLQASAFWLDDGDAATRAQVAATYRLGRRSALQVLGTVQEDGEVGSYRLQWTQEVSRGLQLIAEYGDVPPYQYLTGVSAHYDERLELKVRRTWEVATPAGGGRVEGVVRDTFGRPIPDVAVRLGPYRAFSDARGAFSFLAVPSGAYELRVEEAGAPAHATPVGPPVTLAVDGRSRESAELLLAPLGTIRGHVYVDRDGDGSRDRDEGVSGVVLVLDEEATASGSDGSFAFHNVAPGSHDLRLPTDFLPHDLAADGPSELALGLPPGRSIAALDLRLIERDRPIVFQELQ